MTFLMTGKYSMDAAKKISGKRTDEASGIVRQCEGVIDSVYATMGKNDLLVIAKFPSVGHAMKASVEFTKTFGISFSTTPALPIAEFDKMIGS